MMIHGWMQDVRFAVRLLRKSPGFTTIGIVSLAIGIGANTTIFSIANALLLRPLPGLAAPERLLDIGRTRRGSGFDTASYANYRDIRERSQTLEGVFAARIEPMPMSLGGSDGAERIYGTLVSANYFEVLGTLAHAGRLLRNDDDVEGNAPVAVISFDLWQRRFAADQRIVGSAATINGHPFTIVGVAQPGFRGTTILEPDLWAPISARAAAAPRLGPDLLKERRANWLVLGARMKPGVEAAQVNAELAAIGAALAREYPQANEQVGYRASRLAVVPGQIQIVAGFVGILMALVGLVLLAACANVTGMLLARGAAREREMAVRVAIGAGRGRLLRQLLTETLILFAAAGAAGVVLTTWLTSVLVAVLPQLPMPIAFDVPMDWRVLGFAVAVSLVASLLSGLAPALQATREDLVPALKSEGLGGAHRTRLRNAFVVAQITVSLVLIVAAGLLLRALQRATDIDPGFNSVNVDVVSLDLSLAGYTDASGPAFIREAIARARAMPNVEVATAAVDLPLDGGRKGFGRVRVPGRPQLPDGADAFRADWNIVEPGFFDTLKLRLVRGRDFTEADTAASLPVAIVNEALARSAWPAEDPIGKQLEVSSAVGPGTQMLTVVGVAAGARLLWLNELAQGYLYVPLTQRYTDRISLLVRTGDGRSTIGEMRTIIRSMNPNLPVTEAMPLSQITAVSLIPQRLAAAVAGSLGVVALLLAAIGIFGVTSYAVSRRTREIGIRMALGATREAVRGLVLRQALALAGTGVAAGLAIAAAASKLLESLLFGVSGLDPVTFAGACALFTAVTLIATYVPARRAMSIEPVDALRRE
jgi:putative ABC transport system permease protein